MKKIIVTVILSAALCAAALSACGKDKSADNAQGAETVEDDGSFSLLDVDANMVDVGAYGMDDEGMEVVFTMFTGPDGNKYVSLFEFDNNSDNGDVICGQYEASTEKDENGEEWTYFDVEDVYTDKHVKLGVWENPETEEVSFYNEEGHVVPGKFLTAEETIKYMGSAAGLMSE